MKAIGKMNYLKLCFVLLAIIYSCSETIDNTSDISQMHFCDLLAEDSLITLHGIIHCTTNEIIIFESMEAENEWQKKIQLIPCSEHLGDYVFSYYNSFVYLKNFDDKFWAQVSGQYITTDTNERPQLFVFNFVAITEEPEIITDSI